MVRLHLCEDNAQHILRPREDSRIIRRLSALETLEKLAEKGLGIGITVLVAEKVREILQRFIGAFHFLGRVRAGLGQPFPVDIFHQRFQFAHRWGRRRSWKCFGLRPAPANALRLFDFIPRRDMPKLAGAFGAASLWRRTDQERVPVVSELNSR